ncbi:Fip1-domain-containing protein [Panus rudis PR-1116 ss-1]|nr:Fip1-domain-containing protein [Panus rudis PR-1116 ss-1]
MEPAARSLDFRQQGARPSTGRTSTGPLQTPTRAPAQQQPSLTTEYTPRERGTINKLPSTPSNAPSTSTPAPGPPQADSKSSTDKKAEDAGPDPSTLPVATAPPSHPSIDPSAPGVFDGRSILELDLAALAEKPWRRPGADISDWFNYGFDEISWEAYCYRRRELGEVASVLKANVLNFAGMPEEQLLSLPPDIRTMVMTSATAMMNQAGPNGMMPPGAGMTMNGNGMMNPMMDMNAMMNPMMQDMGVVGMGGDMGAMGGPMPMGGPGPNQGMGAGVMQQGPAPGMGGGGGLSGGVGVGTGAPQGANPEQMVMGGDNFVPGNVGPQGMMTMNMGGEFTLQTNVGQQPFPGAMDQRSNTPVQPVPAQNRAGGPGPFRGRGMPPQMNMRGRGGTYAGRGRLPIRPPSPLPPNVPTGPRNKNKYKDIDGSAPAVDGLDYGGGGGGGGGKESRGTPPDYRDDDRGSRKRRSSPSLDDSRGSKRR